MKLKASHSGSSNSSFSSSSSSPPKNSSSSSSSSSIINLQQQQQQQQQQQRLHAGVGTAHYSAPEVLLRTSRGYLGPPVDVWASGVILYVMNAGSKYILF